MISLSPFQLQSIYTFPSRHPPFRHSFRSLTNYRELGGSGHFYIFSFSCLLSLRLWWPVSFLRICSPASLTRRPFGCECTMTISISSFWGSALPRGHTCCHAVLRHCEVFMSCPSSLMCGSDPAELTLVCLEGALSLQPQSRDRLPPPSHMRIGDVARWWRKANPSTAEWRKTT